MKVTGLVFGFIIIAFMLTGMINFYSELFDNYNVNEAENISIETYGKDMRTEMDTMKDRFDNPQDWTDSVFLAVTGGWNALTTIFRLPSIMLNAFDTITGATPFGLPGWVGSMVNILVWTLVTFTILKALFKVRI